MEQVQAVTDAEFLCVCCLLHSNDQVLPLVICFLKKKTNKTNKTHTKNWQCSLAKLFVSIEVLPLAHEVLKQAVLCTNYSQR